MSKIFSLKLALFFLLLLQRGKFNTLAEINHVYNQLTDVKFNQKRALCVSAHKMEPLQKEKIRKLLESSFGKTILLDEKVTPAILGGFVLFVNNTMLDASVQGKLNGMKKNL